MLVSVVEWYCLLRCSSLTVGLATRQSSKHGKDNAKRKLAELFRPPQELLFNGSFHEVCVSMYVCKYIYLLYNIYICICTYMEIVFFVSIYI